MPTAKAKESKSGKGAKDSKAKESKEPQGTDDSLEAKESKESKESKDAKKKPAGDAAAAAPVAGAGKGKKMVHVRLDGKTKELPLSDLSLSAKSTDDEVLAVLAKHLRVDIERFALFNVERTKDGHIFLRPDALFVE